MITKTVGFKIGEQFFGTIEEAQKAALFNLQSPEAGDEARQGAIAIADWIIENKEAIVDILTTTPNSKPSARKINGGTKRRKVAAMDAAINRSVQDNKQ